MSCFVCGGSEGLYHVCFGSTKEEVDLTGDGIMKRAQEKYKRFISNPPSKVMDEHIDEYRKK